MSQSQAFAASLRAIAASGRCHLRRQRQTITADTGRRCFSKLSSEDFARLRDDAVLRDKLSPQRRPLIRNEGPAGSSSSSSSRHTSPEIAEFANRQPTPLNWREIIALKTSDKLRAILQEELPVRLANRIAHLDTLPNLDRFELIRDVRADYMRAFSDVLGARSSDDMQFAIALRKMKKRNQFHALRMSMGMKEWTEMQLANGEAEDSTNAFVDGFLNRLLLSRIGMETLTSQYLALSKNPNGIVDVDCDPCAVCEKAARHVLHIAKGCMENVPDINVSFHGDEDVRTLPLIPQYLHYIMIELLKNSLRAVVELKKAQGTPGKPQPIRIRIASDESQVAIMIVDRGGGIPFQRQPHVWSYMYSTARGNRVCDETGVILEESMAHPTPLAGYGVGLPMSRLYAEYIGGSLHLMSIPKFGTHAYLYLQQSSEREEALPTYVDWLRKRRLREDIASFETQEKQAAQARDYAEALRLKTLATEARMELSFLET